MYHSLAPGTTLVETLIELGQENTLEVDTVRALLFRFGISETSPPTDAQLVEVVSALSRYAVEGVAMSDQSSLIRAFASFVSLYLQVAHPIY